MKTVKSARKNAGQVFLALFCAGLAWTAQAGSITNNFTSGADYVANGVVGTMWDGVYLGFGDLPGGNNGGVGNGSTLIANEALAGFLTVQSTLTAWAGAGDDGFYLWKIVSGDFDVSVENFNPFENPNYHFGGLLVRAYTTNGPAWGAPIGANGTNAENWLNITRFNEFSIGDQVRYASNANDIQISAPFNSGSTNYNTETNDTRYFRITRSGDTFSFYDKTNQGDAWVLESTITRPDLDGLPMQVGIEDATFSGAAPVSYWTDFELSGTNVATGILPPANPTGVTLSGSNAATGGITLSWTPGAGSAGSIVLVRANSPLLTQVPNNGFVYNGNTNFGSGDQLASGITVVYAGPNSSVTLAGLGGNNNTYYAAVFSYTGSGSSIVYSTNPATANFVGTAAVTNIVFNLVSTNIPIRGVTPASAVAQFSTGSSLDISQDPSTVWGTTDPAIAIASPGAFTGVSNGTVMVSVAYAGVTNFAPLAVLPGGFAFTDNFSTFHDYVGKGLPGSLWDGVYLGTTPGGQSGGNVPLCVANIGVSSLVTNLMTTNNAMLGTVVSNNVLTVQDDNTAWAGTADNGFYLFKQASGDFQVAVHITAYTDLNYHFTGLMARPANPDGTPLGGTEGWIYWDRFDEFGISTLARNDVAASDQQNPQFDGDTTDFWLLMSRVDGTNFYFFKKTNPSDAWAYQPGMTVVRPDLAGVNMQVGIDDATYTPAPLQQVQFDSFMLDATNLAGLAAPPAPPTAVSITPNQDGTITLSWTPSTNGLGSIVVMSAGAPVSAQPLPGVTYTGNSIFGQGSNLGNASYVVYVGTGGTVTVSGLTPATAYYAAVYSYTGSGSTTVYNVTGARSVSTIAEGVVGKVDLTLGGTAMSAGGVLSYTAIATYTNGATQNVTALAAISSSPANEMVGTNGMLTALTNDTITVIATFGGVISSNNPVVVAHNPSFSDNFSSAHSYISSGVSGTMWDGVYLGSGAFPGQTLGGTGGSVSACDASISSNNLLTVKSTETYWAGANDDGFLLFKNIPGDFQAAVQVAGIDRDTNGLANINYQFAGLMARRAQPDGSPSVVSTNAPAENWVYWGEFEQFGDSTESRFALNGGDNERANFDNATNDFWLLMVRSGDTFKFYRRTSATSPWVPQPSSQTIVQPNLLGVPLQVGLFQALYTGNLGTVEFGNFMVDMTTGPMLEASGSGGNVNLSWTTAGSFTLQSSPSLSSPNWQPVAATPVVANGTNTVTLPTSNTTLFFRLVH